MMVTSETLSFDDVGECLIFRFGDMRGSDVVLGLLAAEFGGLEASSGEVGFESVTVDMAVFELDRFKSFDGLVLRACGLGGEDVKLRSGDLGGTFGGMSLGLVTSFDGM
jgi:hypothetical protein